MGQDDKIFKLFSEDVIKSFDQLNKLLRYSTGRDLLNNELTDAKGDPLEIPLVVECGRLFNASIKGDRYSTAFHSHYAPPNDKTAEGLATVLFQIEMFHRLNLFLLTGEYLNLLQLPNITTKEEKNDDVPNSQGYVEWVLNYTSQLSPNETSARIKKSFGKNARLTEVTFNRKHERYFEYEKRGTVIGSFVDDNLSELLSSIEEHYHFTQVEGRTTVSSRRNYMKRFQEYEYPFHALANLLFLNLKITYEDQFFSAESKCLGRLVNYRDQLRKLMCLKDATYCTQIDLETERSKLPTSYVFFMLFKNPAEDEFEIFPDNFKRRRELFYGELNSILSEKFTPVVQGLYEKVNFLIRKLLIVHEQRPIKDHEKKLFDDQRIPLVFLNREIVHFSYENYQISHPLFKWLQRAKYEHSDNQAYLESQVHNIAAYKVYLDTPTDICKYGVLPTLDAYHYATRYFRDFEPSSKYLKKLYKSFKTHFYEAAKKVRKDAREKDVEDARELEKYKPAMAHKEGKNPDPLNETDWTALKQMCNYLYCSYLSLALSGKFDTPLSATEARDHMTHIRMLQDETQIFSYFPYYKYALYLHSEIKLMLDVNKYGVDARIKDLYIQLRETIKTCEHYFILCHKNEYVPFNMPRAECLAYIDPGKNDEIPQERTYTFNVQWEVKSTDLRLFIASSFVFPINYPAISRRIDEMRADAESSAMHLVVALNEKFITESKALKEDFFKTFGWFTGIVAFLVGGIFKMSGSHPSSVFGDIVFMASFGLILMLFLFGLFGLVQPKNSTIGDKYSFFSGSGKDHLTIEGTCPPLPFWARVKKILCVLWRLPKYIAAGGRLWRAAFFIVVFGGIIVSAIYLNNKDDLFFNVRRDSLYRGSKDKINTYVQDSLSKKLDSMFHVRKEDTLRRGKR